MIESTTVGFTFRSLKAPRFSDFTMYYPADMNVLPDVFDILVSRSRGLEKDMQLLLNSFYTFYSENIVSHLDNKELT